LRSGWGRSLCHGNRVHNRHSMRSSGFRWHKSLLNHDVGSGVILHLLDVLSCIMNGYEKDSIDLSGGSFRER